VGAPLRSYAPRVRLSPDGRRLAVVNRDLTRAGLWLYHLDSGKLTALNQDGESDYPAYGGAAISAQAVPSYGPTGPKARPQPPVRP